MTMVRTLILGAVSATLLAGSAVTASAAIVCRGDVCWHTHERYTYPRDSGVTIHEDNWRWGPNEHYTFREPEHEGRGYWRDNRWETFREHED
jgi:hypothetical protein